MLSILKYNNNALTLVSSQGRIPMRRLGAAKDERLSGAKVVGGGVTCGARKLYYPSHFRISDSGGGPI